MTNIHKLWEYKEYINVNGMMLTSELISLLHNSLTLLQVDNHFNHVQYWGQLYAVDADYHIAVGIGEDAISDRKYFYTTDFKFWGLLPKAKKKYKMLSLLTAFPFRGDPSLKFKVLDESLEENHPDRCQYMTEESRLSATISNISDEAEICARGQLIKNPDGTTVVNPNFYGLTAPEAKFVKSYLHIRPAQQRWNTNLLSSPATESSAGLLPGIMETLKFVKYRVYELRFTNFNVVLNFRQDYNYSMDFLDSIDQDIPSGCWNLSLEQAGSVAYLKSLYWPGMTYFHKIQTPDAGFLYVGNGRKCWDVPFLL